MSQQIVLDLLKELGCSATSSQIIKLAKERYPDLSLWQYVGTRLHQLMKWGIIDHDHRYPRTYFIVKAEPIAEEERQWGYV